MKKKKSIRSNLKSKLILGVIRHLQKKEKRKRLVSPDFETINDETGIASILETDEKFRYLVENIDDVIMEAYFDKGCTYVSPAVYNHIGYAPEELIGKTPYDFVAEHDAERLFDEFMRKVKTGEATKNFQITLVHKKGWPVISEINTKLIRDPDGNIIGFYGITRDVTERKRAKDLSDALNDINVAINSTRDISEILQQAIDKSSTAMGCESGFVCLAEKDDWEIKYVFGSQRNTVGIVLTKEDVKNTFKAVSRSKDPLAIENAENSENIDKNLVERFGVKSVLIVPLVIGEEIIGGISFNYHSRQSTFTKAHLDFARKLSSTASLAIENCRLYAEQRQILDTLQKSFLSMPDVIEGIDFGHKYHSSTVSAQVGGDFYDLFELENNKIGVLVGDVSGKGFQAANLSLTIKDTIKAYSYYDDSPSSVLLKVNKIIKSSTSARMFATVFFGILDKLSGGLSYCSAGHPPVIVKRKKSIELLDGPPPAIGVFDSPPYFSHEKRLDKGEILIIYTDGIIEARHNGDFFGEERLLDFIKKIKHPKASELSQLIMDEINRFTGRKLYDDVAILTLSLN